MLNKSFIEEKIELIYADLNELAKIQSYTFDEVAKNHQMYSATKLMLMEVIGRATDINQHIIKHEKTILHHTPNTYKETFLALIDLGILPKKFGEEIAKNAGFRNAIVHDYNNIDKFIVYESVGDAVKQYTKYCKYITRYLEKEAQSK